MTRNGVVVIHLALCANERYFPGVYCAVGSALRSLRSGYQVVVHLIDAGFAEVSKKLLQDLVVSEGLHSLHWLPNPHSRFANLQNSSYHISAFYRLALPELIPDVDRVIYVDADTLVFGCLGELWDNSLVRQESLLAVQDWQTTSIGGDTMSLAHELGVNDVRGYFNSGVLVMKLSTLREEGFCDKIRSMLGTYGERARFPDQTALNWYFAGRWCALDVRWNLPAWAFDNQARNDLPSICHFTNQAPWLVPRYSPSQALFERMAGELGLRLPEFEKGLAHSVIRSIATWFLAPIRCVYQVGKAVIDQMAGNQESVNSRRAFSYFWFDYFFGAPKRLFSYHKRIREIRICSKNLLGAAIVEDKTHS